MKNLVILGAGTGGAIMANLMSRKLPNDWEITVIDQSANHYYQPGFLFLPMRLYGYETADDVVKPIRSPLPERVRFVEAKITAIDTTKRQVATGDGGAYPYDFLVISLGCQIDPEEVEGLPDAIAAGVAGEFYTLEGALDLQRRLDDFSEGKLVVNIAETPIKCPVAPIEFVFLADYYFAEKKIRDQVSIELVTPLTGAFTKPAATAVLSKIADEKGVKITPNFAISDVDATTKTISSYDGANLPFDLLVSIPPHSGPSVVDEADLGAGMGYVHTDPNTLQAKKAENVYALGDVTDVPTSKAGSVAHFEAEVVAENIMREIAGTEPLPDFDGHANCFIESGYHKALLFDFNYETEPLPGDFPAPMVGPFSLLKESTLNHWGKMAFRQVYWNLLLTGHLPGDPFLPAKMSMTGKTPAEMTGK